MVCLVRRRHSCCRILFRDCRISDDEEQCEKSWRYIAEHRHFLVFLDTWGDIDPDDFIRHCRQHVYGKETRRKRSGGMIFNERTCGNLHMSFQMKKSATEIQMNPTRKKLAEEKTSPASIISISIAISRVDGIFAPNNCANWVELHFFFIDFAMYFV